VLQIVIAAAVAAPQQSLPQQQYPLLLHQSLQACGRSSAQCVLSYAPQPSIRVPYRVFRGFVKSNDPGHCYLDHIYGKFDYFDYKVVKEN
jgi:hypothetical protein